MPYATYEWLYAEGLQRPTKLIPSHMVQVGIQGGTKLKYLSVKDLKMP